jgi:hypothetical protein
MVMTMMMGPPVLLLGRELEEMDANSSDFLPMEAEAKS